MDGNVTFSSLDSINLRNFLQKFESVDEETEIFTYNVTSGDYSLEVVVLAFPAFKINRQTVSSHTQINAKRTFIDHFDGLFDV